MYKREVAKAQRHKERRHKGIKRKGQRGKGTKAQRKILCRGRPVCLP